MTLACKVPLSMGFPRQEYWSGLPLPFRFWNRHVLVYPYFFTWCEKSSWPKEWTPVSCIGSQILCIESHVQSLVLLQKFISELIPVTKNAISQSPFREWVWGFECDALCFFPVECYIGQAFVPSGLEWGQQLCLPYNLVWE